jgi:hypothetical protein
MRSIADIAAFMLSLAALMWADRASAQAATYSLSVSRHHDVPTLSEPEVTAILAKAWKMLKKDSSHNDDEDMACDVSFTLKGPVRTFTLPGAAIVDENNIEDVHDVDSNVAGDFHVKIVKEIRFCRPEIGTGQRYDGCSYSSDSRSIIVVHPKLHRDRNGNPLPNYPDYLLWAHEFGHLTGSGHRRDASVALMTACSVAGFKIPDSCVRVSRAECRRLLSGPGKPQAAAFGQCLLPQPVTTCQ